MCSRSCFNYLLRESQRPDSEHIHHTAESILKVFGRVLRVGTYKARLSTIRSELWSQRRESLRFQSEWILVFGLESVVVLKYFVLTKNVQRGD